MIKKYLNLLLGGCSALFALLVFATMAGDAYAKTTLGSVSIGWGSVYGAIGGGSGMLIAALVLFLIGLVAVCAALMFMTMKKYWTTYAFLGAFVFLIVAGVLYFCAATGDYSGFGLGAGSIISAIFCLISGLLAGVSVVLRLPRK